MTTLHEVPATPSPAQRSGGSDSVEESLRHAGPNPAEGLVRWVGSLRYLSAETGQALARLGAALVSLIVFCLVAVTSIAGYWASFIGLHTFAVARMGYDPAHAWLVPVAIDGAALGLSISATVLAWRRSSAPLISLLIMLFTSVSSWINYEHITDPVGREAAALLPFAAVVLLEVLLGLLRRLRGDRPRSTLARALGWTRRLLAASAPQQAQSGYVFVRALLHPIRAWRLLRATFNLPPHPHQDRSPQTDRLPRNRSRDEQQTSTSTATEEGPRDGAAARTPDRRARGSQRRLAAGPAHRGTELAPSSAEHVRAPAPGTADEQIRDQALRWIAEEWDKGRQPTGAEVGKNFERSERWGRNQIALLAERTAA